MPKLLDLFCGEGGAAMGYHRAGFEVVGVDLAPQRHYPFTLHEGDALEFLAAHGSEFDVIHASPPCQAYSIATAGNLQAREKHQRLIAPTRELLEQIGKPWVIENVEKAKDEMRAPLLLCGRMFDLEAIDDDGQRVVLDRHRLFESNVSLIAPEHPEHGDEQVAGVYGGSRRAKLNKATKAGLKPAYIAVLDKYAARHERRGGYVPRSKRVKQELLGIDWMTVGGMDESIPPVFSQWLGGQLIAHLAEVAA